MGKQQHAILKVPSIKVAVPLPADALPRDLVPMEGPAGEPVLELALEKVAPPGLNYATVEKRREKGLFRF
jgi:hypothetical protein